MVTDEDVGNLQITKVGFSGLKGIFSHGRGAPYRDGKAMKHWDAGVLDRKLVETGFGLLLVERGAFEHLEPRASKPSALKLEEVKGQLSKLPTC